MADGKLTETFAVSCEVIQSFLLLVRLLYLVSSVAHEDVSCVRCRVSITDSQNEVCLLCLMLFLLGVTKTQTPKNQTPKTQTSKNSDPENSDLSKFKLVSIPIA